MAARRSLQVVEITPKARIFELLEMPFEQAYSSEIIDAKTILLLQYARLQYLLG